MSLQLTESQQAMWLLHTISGRGHLFNVAECFEFKGKISLEALQQALTHVWRHADTLACRFPHDVNYQAYWQAAADVPQIHSHTLAETPSNVVAYAQQWLQPKLAQSFDLAHEPLMQFTLLRAPQQDYLLILAHHIILDGYGFGLFTQALNRSYNALVSGKPLPTLALGSQLALVTTQQSEAYVNSATQAKEQLNFGLDSAPKALSYSESKADVTQANQRYHRQFSQSAWHTIESAANHVGGTVSELLLAAIAASLVARHHLYHVTLGLVMMNRHHHTEFCTPCVQSNVLPFLLPLEKTHSLFATIKLINQQIKSLKTVQHYRVERLKRDRQAQGKSLNIIGPTVNLLPFAAPPKFGGIATVSHVLSAGTTDDIMLQIHLLGDQPAAVDFDVNVARYDQQQVMQIAEDVFTAAEQWAAQPKLSLAELVQRMGAQ